VEVIPVEKRKSARRRAIKREELVEERKRREDNPLLSKPSPKMQTYGTLKKCALDELDRNER
jgi:hypothetical protein